MYRFFALWIFWACWASAAGWILSALHILNSFGYAVAAVMGLLILYGCWRQSADEFRPPRSARFIIRTMLRGWRRRPLQAMFAILAGAIFIGGALYSPWSFDAASYRLPRILYWWAHDGWYWTNSIDNRMDYSSVGFEWQMLPVELWTRTDRFLFLLNWIPFLFMPALLLRFLRSFRVSRPLLRVLIWVIPSAYCYALQAGGIQNDGYATAYLLAAFAFLDVYARKGKRSDLILSLLAAALLTGSKTSNVFILLPYGLMLARLLRRRRGDFGAVLVAAIPGVLVSFLPLMALCYTYTGDLSGDPHNILGVKSTHKIQTLGGNLALLMQDATEPPMTFPIRHELDRFTAWFNSTAFSQWAAAGHPNYHGLAYGEVVYEGFAGPGMGLFLIVLVIAAFRIPVLVGKRAPYPHLFFGVIAVASWGAFLICLSLISSDAMSRVAAPYYVLLIATLPWLTWHGPWDRSRVIPGVGGLVLAGALLLVLIAPIRPVVPMLSILHYLSEKQHSTAAKVTLAKYEFWAGLRDNLSPIRAALPANDDPIGYAGASRETSYGLWKPFGGRKIFELATPDPRDLEKARHVHLAVVTEQGIQARFGLSLAEWLRRYDVQVLQTFKIDADLTAKAEPHLSDWVVVTWK